MRMMILAFLMTFLFAILLLNLAGHVRDYAPHEGLFLRAQVRQAQLGLVSRGLLAAVYELAHYSNEVPTPPPDPERIIEEVRDSLKFAVCIRVEHVSGSWETGGDCRTYVEEFSYKLPDGSEVKVRIGVVSHQRTRT
ncbi:MAG: hypothetical protein QXJ48_07305 [Candidatus Korarchaeum sp.]